MNYTQINSIEELKQAAEDINVDCVLMLQQHLRSSKRISYEKDTGIFWIFNYIDDTEQELTEQQLMETGIGRAIQNGAFFLEEDEPKEFKDISDDRSKYDKFTDADPNFEE